MHKHNANGRIERNKKYLTDLFAGPFPGHAIIMQPEGVESPGPGDVVTTDKPIGEWADHQLRLYETRLKYTEEIGDDSVPYLSGITGTEVFAAAFGCSVHVYEDSAPAALPAATTAEEADRLAEPTMDHPVFARWFDFAERLRQKAGTEVPIGVPDVQSPFDIAALIWRKQDLFVGLMDTPDAVKRLVDKCGRVMKAFFDEFMSRFPNINLCHCPYAWAPPELGIWLSEDEAGSISTNAFAEFCLPWLVDLSETYGGMFMHSCAAADHQYGNFNRIPNLRGLNRVFQEPGARPAIEAFSGRTVLIMAWSDEQAINDILDMALPDTRFVFNMPAQPLDEAKATFERLRERCPRAG